MAVIQKIRDSYGKIAGGIIAVSLISFIISDAFNGSFSGLFSSRTTHVATIDGTKIESKEYELRVKEYEILTSIFNQRASIDEASRAQIREQVLQTMEYETIVGGICDKLGITTTKEEEKQLIYSPNAHPLVRQFTFEGQPVFSDPNTKQFDPARVKGIEDEILKNPKMDPYGKFTETWNAVKTYVIRSNRIEKFNTMFANSAYMPIYAAVRQVKSQSEMASIRYVKVPYSSIPDNEVKVSDDDLKDFINKHKAIFETDEETRSIEYVSFDILPASGDTGRVLAELNAMKADFATTKDNATFVSNKTDDPSLYTEAYMTPKTFSGPYADTLMSLPVGTIYGPYVETGSLRLTKVTDKKSLPDSVKVRHLLVKVSDPGKEILSDSAAKRKIDSMVAQLNAGVNFDTLVQKCSDDDGSKPTHGEYWFNLQQRPTISKSFGDFAFEGHSGEKKVVKADNSKNNGYVGYHYIEILENKGTAPTMQLATISKSLLPSDSTSSAIFGMANDFTSKSTNAAAFDANANKNRYNKRLADNLKASTHKIEGIGNAREIVKWAYEHKVGDISTDPFRIGEERFVVAKIISVEPKGIMGLNANSRPMLEQRVREDKKAEMIKTKYANQSLEAIAAATAQTVAQNDSIILGQPTVNGLGYEPKLVGYTFCKDFAPGKLSPAIKGNGGIYFITLNGRTTVPANPMTESAEIQRIRLSEMDQTHSFIGQIVQQALLKKASISYEVKNF